MIGDRIQELARSWAAAQSRSGGPMEDEWPLIYEVIDLTFSDAETLWQFVLQVLALPPSDNALGMLAAGPLEDIVQDHGPAFIERVANEAERNPAFAALLRMVWIPASEDPVTKHFIQLGCDEIRQQSNNS